MPHVMNQRIVHFMVSSVTSFLGHLAIGKPIKNWGPTVCGLLCIPFMPLLDPYLHRAIEASFSAIWPFEMKTEHK